MSAAYQHSKDNHLEKIETQIQSYFKHLKSDHSINFNADMALYQLSTGGKRLRALLPSMIFDFYKAGNSNAYALGIAAELIHNATLIHDDLQDGDTTRRKMPTLWKKYGMPHAINSGDALFQHALYWLLKLDCDNAIKLKIIEMSITSTLAVIEGQSQEFLMQEEWNPSVERYIEVVQGKTSMLFSFIVESSLLLLGKSQAFIDSVSSSVTDIGVLFQINDDILDVYGDKGRDQIGSDIAEGKISALVSICHTLASDDDKLKLREVLQKPRAETTSDDIKTVISIFDKYKSRTSCNELIRSYKSRIMNPVIHDKEATALVDEVLLFFGL